MQSIILTEDNLITKFVTITFKLLNLKPLKYQVKRVSVINDEEISDANIKFVEMMNIRL